MSDTYITSRLTQKLMMPIMKTLHATSSTIAKLIVAGIIIFQLICLFLPFYYDKKTFLPLSAFDLALATHGYEYIGVFVLYILSLILLIPNSRWIHRISFVLFIIAFTLGFYIGFQFLDDEGKAPQISGLMNLFFFFYWMFVPLFGILFYIPLVSSKESLEKGMKQYKENRRWNAKTPLRVQIIPAILALALTVLFVIGCTYLHEYLICNNVTNCQIWGSWLDRTAYFFLGSTLFFVSIFMVFWKGEWTNKNEQGLWKFFLVLGTILLILGTYAGFTSYTKTSNEDIDYRDFLNETINGNPSIGNVKFSNVSSLRRDSGEYYSDGKTHCSYTLTLFTKDNKVHKFNSDISEDKNFVYFLVFEKKIKPLRSQINECGAPNDYFISPSRYIIPE